MPSHNNNIIAAQSSDVITTNNECQNIITGLFIVSLIFVSGFEKRDHFALKVNFKLVVQSHSTVDGLSVALCCTSIAAPVPELCSLKVRKYAWCKPSRFCICKHGDGVTSLLGLKHWKGLGVSNLAKMLGLYHRYV